MGDGRAIVRDAVAGDGIEVSVSRKGGRCKGEEDGRDKRGEKRPCMPHTE